VIIIGFGVVGHAAFEEAISKNLPIVVILSNSTKAQEILKRGANVLLLNKNDDLKQQQIIIKNALLDADIVISSARSANQLAPLLIPLETLKQMKKGSVIVDMALSEGGNVEGSEHDSTRILGNGIIVTNTSGYPKAVPHESSKLFA
jgi:NAD/NADP transhydrogenase alpha subunit